MRLTTSQAANASGGLTYGTATINFGAAPGTNYVTVNVTGQTDIASGSNVWAWVYGGDSTATHNSFEHTILPLWVNINTSAIIAGTGFTINAFTELRLTGTLSVRWAWE